MRVYNCASVLVENQIQKKVAKQQRRALPARWPLLFEKAGGDTGATLIVALLSVWLYQPEPKEP